MHITLLVSHFHLHSIAFFGACQLSIVLPHHNFNNTDELSIKIFLTQTYRMASECVRVEHYVILLSCSAHLVQPPRFLKELEL